MRPCAGFRATQLLSNRLIIMLLEVSHHNGLSLLVGQPAYRFSYFHRQFVTTDLLTRPWFDADPVLRALSVIADPVSPGPGISGERDSVDVSARFAAVEFLHVLPHSQQRVLHRFGE